MRPPLIAGENAPPETPQASTDPRFNEAPADRGGKPKRQKILIYWITASMRPPLIAGENQITVKGTCITHGLQ